MIEYDKYDTCPWKPTLGEEWLDKFLKKNFKPIKYNQFRWWRQWAPKKKTLSKYCLIEDKINNGDYSELSYKYEAQLIEHRLRRRWSEYYNDHQQYLEKSAIDIARRKKLLEDFEKSEKKRLHSLYKDISDVSGVSIEQIQEDIIKSERKSLYMVYKELSKKYS